MQNLDTGALRIISTGGTFEKSYDPIRGVLGFTQSHLETIVGRARIDGELHTQVLMLIDSLDMQDQHRQQILAACQASRQPRIVIIHGTDTMTETAQVLGAAALDQTIVLTGAMVPFDVAGSDALFNLGFAVACARSQPAGVYVAMNARLFAGDQVRKNREAGRFEALPFK